jgi:hypothetical protein
LATIQAYDHCNIAFLWSSRIIPISTSQNIFLERSHIIPIEFTEDSSGQVYLPVQQVAEHRLMNVRKC